MSASLSPFGLVERDSIIIQSLSVIPRILNRENPGQNELHPALVHLRVIPLDGFSGSVKHDCLGPDTLSYFDLSEQISSCLNPSHGNSFESVYDLLSGLQTSILCNVENQQASNRPNRAGIDSVETSAPPTKVDHELSVDFPSLASPAKQLTISRSSALPDLTRIHIHQIKIHSIIGILPHERTTKQSVLVSLLLWNTNASPLDIHALTESVHEAVSQSSFHTVEALADSIASRVLAFQHNPISKPIQKVTVTVEKPQAVSCASGVGVQITRALN